LPTLGKRKPDSRRACPGWANANQMPGELAKFGQTPTGFQASLPELGKDEPAFRSLNEI